MSNTVLKGYDTHNKSGNFNHANVERVGEDQYGLLVSASMFYEIAATDTAEAASTASVITATAHVSREGDKIRFTAGANSGYERRVTSVAANSITVLEDFPAAPGVGDTFQILRPRSPTVDQLGSIGVTYAEDAPHTSGDSGNFVLAVRNDAATSLVGADGDYAPLQVDATGNLKVAATIAEQAIFAEDAAHVSGNSGKFMLAVRNDVAGSMVSADGDYAPIQVDATGNVRVSSSSELATAADGAAAPALGKMMGAFDGANLQYVSSNASGELIDASSKIEDVAHASGDRGTFVLAVRNDAAASLVGTDGDYAPLQVDATGNLKVAATVTEQAIFAEDAVHTTGDNGKFVLAVRNDASSSLVSADGDYAPLQVNATGELKVAATFTEVAVFAEDSAHASGNSGKFVLAVRNDAASSLVGTDGDYAPLQVNATGELKVAASFTEVAVFAEDSVHTTGDNGKFVLGVRNDAGTSLVSADGDYAPMQVDATGALRVTTVTESAIFAEDSAHVSGNIGKFVLAVRQDATASLVGTDGDYAPLQVDANGLLKVAATVTESGLFAEDSVHTTGDQGKFVLSVRNDANTSLVSADGDYAPIQVNSVGRAKVSNDSSFAEDSVHGSGDVGSFVLAVRQDATGSLVSADGDYAPLQVDANGLLKVASTFTEAAVFAEDSVHASGDNGKFVLAVRRDANTSLVSADGDYAPLQVNATGELKVAGITQNPTVGRSVITTTRNDYSSVNVTTGAWVQLIASTAATINEFDIFDSSGETLEIGTGAAAAEVRLVLVFPGGNGRIPVAIASGTRISIRAVSATASTGEIDINWYS